MQNKNRLGCLTSTGIFTTLITALAIVGVAFASGSSMFSAGDLNAQGDTSYGGVTSHAQITECSACHTAPWEKATMADRCTNCHTDIASQMRNVAQLHGALFHGDPTLSCRHCHPEHRGANAPFTVMNDRDFPHDSFGYSLAGHERNTQNQPFTCKECHNNDLTTFSPDTCQNCHQQMDIVFTQTHVLEFGTDCLACHDGMDRYGEDFSHNNFTFSLIGKHTEIACSQCHLNARSIADLQSTPKDCFSCHQKDDEHAGKFGNDCGVCHSSEGWQPAKFDHNLAAFKLEGKHAGVKCEQCHINNVFKGTPSDCFSCHQKDDEHNGQFGTDCSGCHTPDSWENATFDHSRSNFPLTGSHINLDCTRCHTNGQFKGTPTACASCHADPIFHAGALGTDCASCHNTSVWTQASFNLSHPEPSTEEGGSGIFHGGATCRQCHPSSVREATCTACHDSNNPSDGGGDD